MSEPVRQLLAVDVGNSTTVVGWFPQLKPNRRPPPPRRVWRLRKGDPAVLEDLHPEAPPPACWAVASVCRPAEQRLRQWVARRRPEDTYRLLTRRDLPLEVDVRHPDRVGVDRLCAAYGALVMGPADRPTIVVDAGTAITVDLVSPNGVFRGGLILPGAQMAARALHEQTDLLPLIGVDRPTEVPSPIGKSTEDAIYAGVYWGAVGAVREAVRRIADTFEGNPMLFLTGGEARWLAEQLRVPDCYMPHLVLCGIAAAAARAAEPWARDGGEAASPR